MISLIGVFRWRRKSCVLIGETISARTGDIDPEDFRAARFDPKDFMNDEFFDDLRDRLQQVQ